MDEATWPNCACGCGRPVATATKTDNSKGHVKGQALKYHSIACANLRSPLRDSEYALTTMACCAICGQTKPLAEFHLNNTAKSGFGKNCLPCDKIRRRELRASKAKPFREKHRKLPPYEELKALYVGTATKPGRTFAELGRMFKMKPETVCDTLNRRARQRGEYPLISREEVARRRAVRTRQANSLRVVPNRVAIAEMVKEFMVANDMTEEDFAGTYGFRVDYIHRLFTEPGGLAARFAVRLLEAIGEPVAPHLQKAA